MKRKHLCCLVLACMQLWAPRGVWSTDDSWWLRELKSESVPAIAANGADDSSPIDFFIDRKLRNMGLERSSQAAPRELIRRVYFDVIGLPPSPETISDFVSDPGEEAYENLVDRLLHDPGYGEKWAGHWLDLVHFAETHGHDEDAIREHAWQYRDYVINALNDDRPYGRFVEDQIAGDILYPEDRWSWVGVGFLAAGPWDSSSQQGIQDGTVDKRIAQMMDRDDMITSTMSTFTSLTVHCARCHDHKFDPISQEDYFSLQAVFAGVDRANRSHDSDPEIRRRRKTLEAALDRLEADEWPDQYMNPHEARSLFIDWLSEKRKAESLWMALDRESLSTRSGSVAERLEDGSWLFSGDHAPEIDSYTIEGYSGLDSVAAIRLELLPHTSLPHGGPGRQLNGNLHLSELRVESIEDGIVSLHELRPEARSDFDQQGWDVSRAVDGDESTAWGIYPEVGEFHQAVVDLTDPIVMKPGLKIRVSLDQLHGGRHLIGRFRLSVSDRPSLPAAAPVTAALRPWLEAASIPQADELLPELKSFLKTHIHGELGNLPSQTRAYVATSQFEPVGNFKPAREPRPVNVLKRGDIHRPGEPAEPGSLSCLKHQPPRFDIPASAPEGMRRAALAQWLSDPENPLTWRSIVNRIWLHYFGRGIVATPNDFGRMGSRPSHPDLLDFLAGELIRSGGSLKQVHKSILMSRTYRQSSAERADGLSVDPQNQYYWRANLRMLPAEAVRDAILAVSNNLDRTMGGPSARHFIASRGVHVTPNLDYSGFAPESPENQRRAIYRFRFRTVPDPFMKVLNCADASQLTPVRSESVTSFQALALLHNRWVIYQSQQWAQSLKNQFPDADDQIGHMGLQAYGRSLSMEETRMLSAYAREHGLANACRMIFNSNEFLFLP